MTQRPHRLLHQFALAAATTLLVVAGPALAQEEQRTERQVETWRSPDPTPPKPKNATSSESATQPTAAEQREIRKMASAIFAKPGAAARAADKAAPPNTADIPPAQAKPEWLAEDRIGPGGDGLQVKTPF